jgi:hypothetical protein
MAEVLAEFADAVVGSDGCAYHAQATGAQMGDGLWEGWIEFVPVGGGPAIRSPRETTQPNRTDAVYWATGLTTVYLEGALRRALNPMIHHVPAPAKPIFNRPAPDMTTTVGVPAGRHDAVLDPFSVYEKGELLLRKELGALSAWHLVNIIQAHGLSGEPVSVLNRLPASSLVEIIVGAVRESPVR